MTVAAATAIPARSAGKLRGWLSVRHSLPGEDSRRARPLRALRDRPWPRRRRRDRCRRSRPPSHRARAVAPPLRRSECPASRARRAGAHRPARHRLPDSPPRRLRRGCCSGSASTMALLRSRSFAPRSCLPAHSPSSPSSPIRPPRRGWPASGSPTPSPTATSTSTRASSSSLYDPYAAVPSMHVGYALIIGTSPALRRSPPAGACARSALRAVRPARGRRHRQPLLLRCRRRRTRRRG